MVWSTYRHGAGAGSLQICLFPIERHQVLRGLQRSRRARRVGYVSSREDPVTLRVKRGRRQRNPAPAPRQSGACSRSKGLLPNGNSSAFGPGVQKWIVPVILSYPIPSNLRTAVIIRNPDQASSTMCW